MICGSSDILYRFGNDRILPNNTCDWNRKSSETKGYVGNYARYTKLKIISSGLHWDIWLLWEYQNKIQIYN